MFLWLEGYNQSANNLASAVALWGQFDEGSWDTWPRMVGSDENSRSSWFFPFVSGAPRCTAFIPFNYGLDFSSAFCFGVLSVWVVLWLLNKSLLCLDDGSSIYTHTHTKKLWIMMNQMIYSSISIQKHYLNKTLKYVITNNIWKKNIEKLMCNFRVCDTEIR